MLTSFACHEAKNTSRINITSPRQNLVLGSKFVPTNQPKNKSTFRHVTWEPNHLTPALTYASSLIMFPCILKGKNVVRRKTPRESVRRSLLRNLARKTISNPVRNVRSCKSTGPNHHFDDPASVDILMPNCATLNIVCKHQFTQKVNPYKSKLSINASG